MGATRTLRYFWTTIEFGWRKESKKVWQHCGRGGRCKQWNCRHIGPTTKIYRRLDKGFYKMDKQKITTIREDLMDDFNALAQVLSEKIRKLREEFDDDQLQFKMELEAY